MTAGSGADTTTDPVAGGQTGPDTTVTEGAAASATMGTVGTPNDVDADDSGRSDLDAALTGLGCRVDNRTLYREARKVLVESETSEPLELEFRDCVMRTRMDGQELVIIGSNGQSVVLALADMS
jgi:hypothetical protein